MIKVEFEFLDNTDEVITKHTLYFKTVSEMEAFMGVLNMASKQKFAYTYHTVDGGE